MKRTRFVLSILLSLFLASTTTATAAPENDELVRRAQLSNGDWTRLHRVMAKARRGGNVTVAVIGGSITEGARASRADVNYGHLVAQWWKDSFPRSQITFVNAGVGATGSLFGALRAPRDLLARHPDFVVEEFAVNDGNIEASAETFEGLTRQILTQSNDPAVLLLFMMHQDGHCAQEWESKVGRHYDLPMVSYHDAFWPEIEARRLTWADISPDIVHPNDRGHAAAAQFIVRTLDAALKSLPAEGELLAVKPLPAPLISDRFQQVSFTAGVDLQPAANTGWSFEKGAWKSDTPGSTIEFQTHGQTLYLTWHRLRGAMGRASVQVDDASPTTLDGWFAGTWGGYRDTRAIARNLAAGEHRIRIKLLEEKDPLSTGHLFRISAIAAIGVEPPAGTQRAATTSAVGPRITVRAGRFAYADSGEPFKPRGFNYMRLRQSPKIGLWHGTFSRGKYDPNHAQEMLEDLHRGGFNVVRVFLDPSADEGMWDAPREQLSGKYLENVTEFLTRAATQNVHVIVTTLNLPEGKVYLKTGRADVAPLNATLLDEKRVAAKARYMSDVVREIQRRDAKLLANVLAWEIDNESCFYATAAPFDKAAGEFEFAGQKYDLGDDTGKQRLADAAAKMVADACTDAVHKVDPAALVSMNVFTFAAVGRRGPGRLSVDQTSDARFPVRPMALIESKLAYLDVHSYPLSASTLQSDLKSIEAEQLLAAAKREGKPLIMGEFGAFKKSWPTIEQACDAMQRQVREAQAAGFAGFLFWTYDGDKQPELWSGKAAGGTLFEGARK